MIIYDTDDRQTDRKTNNNRAPIGYYTGALGKRSQPNSYCVMFSRRQRQISNLLDIQKPSGTPRRALLSVLRLLADPFTHNDQNLGDQSPILPQVVDFNRRAKKCFPSSKSGHKHHFTPEDRRPIGRRLRKTAVSRHEVDHCI